MQSGSSENSTSTLPVFTTTPYGVRAHLPIIEIDSQGCLIAILSATREVERLDDRSACSPNLSVVGLTLRPCTVGADPQLPPLYYTSVHGTRYGRLVDISTSNWDSNHEWKFKGWKDVYIVPAPRHPPPSLHSIPSLLACRTSTPFRIPQRYLRALESQMIFSQWSVSTTLEHSVLERQDDNQSVTLTLSYSDSDDAFHVPDPLEFRSIYLSYGRCFKHPLNSNLTTNGLGRPWLSISEQADCTHNCETDHVGGPGGLWLHFQTKKWVFDHSYGTNRSPAGGIFLYYTMSLSPCLIHPATSYVIHLTATHNPPSSRRELQLYNFTVPSMSSFWEAAVKELEAKEARVRRLVEARNARP